jgi:type IV pilus assembly protein PilM
VIAGWFNRNRSPIGLDIGSSHIRMIQLEKQGASWSVAAAASARLPDDLPLQGPVRTAALTQTIQDMRVHHPFQGRKVVSALPAASVQCKNLRLPRMPREELTAAVEWEASDRLHLPIDSLRLQYLDAGEIRQGEELRHEIILLAASHQDIEEHLQVLCSCDLTPQAIDSTPTALARCISGGHDLPADVQTQVVLDVGQTNAKITIVRQGRIVFFKIIQIGGNTFDHALAQQLQLPLTEASQLRKSCLKQMDRDASDASSGEVLFGVSKRENVSRAVYESLRGCVGDLAREVGLCLRYYSVTFRSRRPDTLILTGGEAGQTHLPQLLADGAELAVQSCETLDQLDWSRVPGGAPAEVPVGSWAMAAGLAMRSDSLLSIKGAA